MTPRLLVLRMKRREANERRKDRRAYTTAALLYTSMPKKKDAPQSLEWTDFAPDPLGLDEPSDEEKQRRFMGQVLAFKMDIQAREHAKKRTN